MSRQRINDPDFPWDVAYRDILNQIHCYLEEQMHNAEEKEITISYGRTVIHPEPFRLRVDAVGVNGNYNDQT